jgi:hypothetical protein
MTVQVSVAARKPALWRVMKRNAVVWRNAFVCGFTDGREGEPLGYFIKASIAAMRERHGFVPRYAPFLTAGETNHKLNGSTVYTMGRTLAHADMSGYEACPFRGDCTKPCVVGNGNGRYESVQRAWLWRTVLLAEDPYASGYIEGWELGRAVERHGKILYRPDVNSDTRPWEWASVYSEIEPWVKVYGYTKDPSILGEDAISYMYGNNFNYAYSWNERSNLERVRNHLSSGGRVAVVTSRRKGDEPNARFLREMFGSKAVVVDADVTDEWMFTRSKSGVVGDLSAKGRARQLIGSSGFVVVTH